MHGGAAQQTHPAREAEAAEGEGGEEGAGEAVDDDQEPQLVQAQNADTIGLWREGENQRD